METLMGNRSIVCVSSETCLSKTAPKKCLILFVAIFVFGISELRIIRVIADSTPARVSSCRDF
jgi:hypothetical protein